MSAAQQSAGDRLSRLLAMVPYLVRRQGIRLSEVAEHFGITEEQVVDDLQLLFVCGLPGHMPDDLIEAEWESGQVFVTNADAISHPLRLGMDEAVTLLAGLHTLADAPGAVDVEALAGAQAKLAAATGDAAQAAAAVTVSLDDESDAELLAALREAVSRHRRVHLRYLVPGRDEATERDVDPMRVVSLSGRWYLEAWCHRARGVRLFRLSRVLDAQVLDVDGTPPQEAVQRDLAELFVASDADTVVTVHLDSRQLWVIDTYGAEEADDARTDAGSASDADDAGPGPASGHPGGRTVTVRTADPGSLRQLALRTGGQVQLLHPEDVRRAVADEAAAALRRYSTPQA